MQKLKTKICIIGGGPAGSTASLFLSKHKISHVLLDKQSFPRHKVCGEAYDGRVWHNLNRLSPAFVDDMIDKRIISKSWNYSITINQKVLNFNLDKTYTPRILTQRFLFDNYLIKKAKESPYAQIIENQNIKGFEYTKDGIVFNSDDYQVEAELGLIAAGSFSSLSNHNHSKEDIYLFERTYFKNFEPKQEYEVEIYFIKKPITGYLYVCPAGPDIFNVSIAAKKEELKKNNLKISDFLDVALSNYPDIKRRINAADQISKPKGTFMSFKHQKLNLDAGKRLLNIGASAFCINPITGAGVGNAMTMARLSVEAIHENKLNKNLDSAVLKSYTLKANKALKPLMNTNIVVSFLIRHLSFFEPFIGLFTKSQAFQNFMKESNVIGNIGNFKFYLKNFYRAGFKKQK